MDDVGDTRKNVVWKGEVFTFHMHPKCANQATPSHVDLKALQRKKYELEMKEKLPMSLVASKGKVDGLAGMIYFVLL